MKSKLPRHPRMISFLLNEYRWIIPSLLITQPVLRDMKENLSETRSSFLSTFWMTMIMYPLFSFGEGARIIGSGITTAKNKVKLNQDIDQNINFKHQFSDIRAGLKILSESKKTLFRQSGNMRNGYYFFRRVS